MEIPIPFPIRKRPRLPRSVYCGGHDFFVTFTTHSRKPWFELFPELAQRLCEIIVNTAAERGTLVYAWCVMPEHCHLLVWDDDLLAFVRLVKGRLTPSARNLLPIGHALWQQSFYDHALRKEESMNAIAEYILDNPVRRGIVHSATSYKWSGSMVWPNWRSFFEVG